MTKAWIILLLAVILNFVIGQILYQRKYDRDKKKYESNSSNSDRYEDSDKYLKRQRKYRCIKRNGWAHLFINFLDGSKL